MFDSRYSKVLTTILIIVIIAIIGLLGFLGYDYYQNITITKDTSDFVEDFRGDITDDLPEENITNNENITPPINENPLEQLQDPKPSTNTNTGTPNKQNYKGFGVLGTMEIPAINFNYPILDRVTKDSIEKSVAFLYGVGINKEGNSVIVGHNYRNGLFFSNNKKLKIGDKIFITDAEGKKLTYTIYSRFETTDTDTSFYQRDTAGKAEVTLSTCTDDSKARLIILAKAE